MKYYILTLLIVFIQFSCKQSSNGDNASNMTVSPSSTIPDQKVIDQLLVSAIKGGNNSDYSKAAAHYFLQEHREEFFFYAFVMARKHSNAQAYFDLFYILTGDKSEITSVNEIDPLIRDFALYCLLRSYELKYDRAAIQVNDLFSSKIPSSKDYRNAFFDE